MTPRRNPGITIIILLMSALSASDDQFILQAAVSQARAGTQAGGRGRGKGAAGKSTATTNTAPKATKATEGPPAGRLDNKRTYIPTSYADWTAPALGSSYIDPAFGTKITRLSDGMAQFNCPVHHEYATMSPFNKNNTRLLLLADGKGFYIADLQGKVIVSPADLGVIASSEPRWSATDPDVFYYHDYQSNQLRKYDLKTRRSGVVHTFTQFREINFGGGESDISEDGNHLVIIGDGRHVGVYSFDTNTLGPTLDVNGLGGGFDYFDMTPDNNVIVRWNAQGNGRYKGFELYDKDMWFTRQIYPYGAHADRGRDLNGEEVLLVLAATDHNPPPGCEKNGIEKIRLKDGRKTCLMGLNWDVGTHISANSDGSNPWVLIEATEERNGVAKPNAALPRDWRSQWKPYYNEILMVKIDGSEARRIAHHRSRSFDGYWFSPRAAISRDGAYAVFDSNFGAYPTPDYTDVFLIPLRLTQSDAPTNK